MTTINLVKPAKKIRDKLNRFISNRKEKILTPEDAKEYFSDLQGKQHEEMHLALLGPDGEVIEEIVRYGDQYGIYCSTVDLAKKIMEFANSMPVYAVVQAHNHLGDASISRDDIQHSRELKNIIEKEENRIHHKIFYLDHIIIGSEEARSLFGHMYGEDYKEFEERDFYDIL